MTPLAFGTDIFDGLWRLGVSNPCSNQDPKTAEFRAVSKTVWILSDMMNETKEFPMPALLEMRPEGMLDRAKSNGHIVPLNGYRVSVCGAAPKGLTPEI